MSNRETLMPTEATDALIERFSDPTRLAAELIAEGQPVVDVIARMTVIVAPAFTMDLPTVAAEVEYLAGWFRALKKDCSIKYMHAGNQNPAASREELNQDEELQVLNGIRRGVRRVMIQRHAATKGKRR